MISPTNHTITIHAGLVRDVSTPVTYVKDLCATYSTGSKEATGHYRVSAKVFTASQTYIYMGIFTRD